MQPAVIAPLRSFLRNTQCVRTFIPIKRPTSGLYTPAGVGICAVHKNYWSTSSLTPFHPRTISTKPQPSTPTIQVDPSRPSLFYHSLPAPNPLSAHLPAYAVSFLNQTLRDAHSPAVLGWLPAASSAQCGEEAGLSDFKENPTFVNVLHNVIRKAIEDGTDERLNAEAVQLGQGWMHINDDRNLPVMGRISSPDDIIATVRVEGGQMLPQTYSPMPAYRTCTADGLTTLSEGLERRLLEELRRGAQ